MVKWNAKITLVFNNMQVVGHFYFGMLDGNCPIINVKKLQPKHSANAQPHIPNSRHKVEYVNLRNIT